MTLLTVQNRIRELMSIFVAQVKGATAMGQTDINHVAETVLVPLFAEVYGYTHLKNLNFAKGQNYPGIDLGDDVAAVAIQVTSDPSSKKVQETLQKFVDYELHKTYSRLLIYVLTDKQQSYGQKNFEKIALDKVRFSADSDILDYTDILHSVASFQIDRATRVQNILEANFSDGRTPLIRTVDEEQNEVVALNLLEISFPDVLYVADIAIDSNQLNKAQSSGKQRKFRPTRDSVKRALKEMGYRFAVDWECNERKIITFHDLYDENLPLSHVIDKGTITTLSPEEFYEADEDNENVFKSLLRLCLQQKLYHQDVSWQNEEHLFIFMEVDGLLIREEKWVGEKENERIVYQRTMKNNKPDEILDCKHLGFSVQFKQIEQKWYMLIKPDWFFSFDGYKKSYYGADKIDWLKRNEDNQQLYDQLRFITYFLKNEKPSDLFVKRTPYRFLSFGDLITFDCAPPLPDREWNPPKTTDGDPAGHEQMTFF